MNAGTTLDGRYTIDRELGRGGMATVYAAHDTRHGRQVALKLFHSHVARAIGSDRFLREIAIAAQLQHPGIVPLFDSGQSGDGLYYVMPLIEGETLRDRLERERRLDVTEAVRLVREIADALGYAHRKGVIHRDVKPENVLLQHGRALVADFGIARALATSANDRLTETGYALGTPRYMSPEQASGEMEIDARSDIFSLGCLLFELVTGAVPFEGPTPQATLVKRITDPAPSLRSRRPDAPEWLDRAVARALARNPADRFGSIDDLLVELNPPTAANPITAAPGGPSVVVLPFQNLSPDPDTDYFSDGLTDELIADLSKVRAIRVIARTSSMHLKGTTKDAPTLGRELNVRYVMNGSVRRAGNALRITAQLVDVGSNSPVWGEKYSGSMTDVFELQERLSREMVEALRVELTPEESKRLADRPVADLQAYDCYLRALSLAHQFQADKVRQAVTLTEEALRITGDNALLLGTLAYVHLQMENLGIASAEALEQADRYADRADALGPPLPIVYVTKGLVAQRRENGAAAIPWLRKSLTFSRDPTALGWLAIFLAERGEDSASGEAVGEALALDPFNIVVLVAAAICAVYRGRPTEGLQAAERALVLHPGQPVLQIALALAAVQADRRDVTARLAATLTTTPMGTIMDAIGPLLVASLGAAEDARAQLTDALLSQLWSDEGYAAIGADIFALLDDRANTLRYLERAIDRGFVYDTFFSTYDRCLARYRDDPEFQRLIAKARRLRLAHA